jgi:dihydroflavonol-4-reductase
MRCLVTGANGFVGAAVVRELLRAQYGVRALVRATSDCRNLDGLDVERALGDITDYDSVRAATSGCRFVFHVAADYRLWTPDEGAMYATNVDGSRTVLRAAIATGVERLVYTSSVATLGIHADRSAATEDSPVSIDDMIGPYKRSKYLAEEAVRSTAANENFDLVIVNPSTPIGPGDFKPTPTGRIILDAARGRMPAYVDTGLNIVHVDDVARGHVLALESGSTGERYILGGTNLSLEEILRTVAQHVGRPPPRVRLPRFAVYPIAYTSEFVARFTHREPQVTVDGLRMSAKHMYFSSAKAESALGYRARSAETAIDDAIDWFRSNAYL